MPSNDVEIAIRSRFEKKFTALVADTPAFDVYSTLIDMLMKFLTDSLSGTATPKTPADAIAKVKSMSPFRQSFLRAQAVRAVRQKHGKKAADAVNPTVDAIIKESTVPEQEQFAGYILNITDDSYVLI